LLCIHPASFLCCISFTVFYANWSPVPDCCMRDSGIEAGGGRWCSSRQTDTAICRVGTACQWRSQDSEAGGTGGLGNGSPPARSGGRAPGGWFGGGAQPPESSWQLLRIFGCQTMYNFVYLAQRHSQEFSCEPNFGGGVPVPPAVTPRSTRPSVLRGTVK